MEITFVSNQVLSLEDAARELDINRATLYRWIARNKVTRLNLGKTPLIPKSEVDRLQTIGAKRKYERHQAPAQIPKVLQPFPAQQSPAPITIPKVIQPFSS